MITVNWALYIDSFSFCYRPKKNRNKLFVLLLLHGTGGNEDDLIPVGKMLCQDCALLSPRGMVTENGMPRFFRRLAEGIFDIEDLKYRTHELADFIKKASRYYGFDLNKTVAVGFSNGGNIGKYDFAQTRSPFRGDTFQGDGST